MAWNDSDKGNNPWGNKNQPPDLDEALKKLQAKLKKLLFGAKPSIGTTSSQTPNVNGDFSDKTAGFIGGIIALAVLVIWALSGIYIVDPAEQAVVLRLGRYYETVGPGPHWIPRLIDTKVVYDVEQVLHYAYSAQMLTQDESLVSVSVAVQYRIGDLKDYLLNVKDPEESLKQATSSALRMVMGRSSLDQIITEGREAWGLDVQEYLIKILDSYKTGIVIVNVSPQPASAPENVQDAFDDAIKAQEDARRFIDQAKAYEARVVPIAKGHAQRILQDANAYAKQVVLRATGDVAAFSALLPEYLKAPAVVSERMYLEAISQVLSRSSKIIIDNKAGNMVYLPLDKLSSGSLPSALKSGKESSQMPAIDANGQLINPAGTIDTLGDNATRSVGREGRIE